MNRLLKFVAPVLLAPLLMAAGGDAPLPAPQPGETFKFTNDLFIASILVDPHNEGASPSAKMARIQIFNKQRSRLLGSAEFKVLPNKEFGRGCILSDVGFPDLTAARFIFDPASGSPIGLDSWVPEATVRHLFEPLGITNLRSPSFPTLPPGTVAPVITAIGAADCVRDLRQEDPSIIPPVENRGILLMQDVVIEFVELVQGK